VPQSVLAVQPLDGTQVPRVTSHCMPLAQSVLVVQVPLGVQVLAAVAAMAYSGVASLVILKAIAVFVARASPPETASSVNATDVSPTVMPTTRCLAKERSSTLPGPTPSNCQPATAS